MGENKVAIKNIRESVLLNDKNEAAYYNLGVIYEDEDDLDMAMEAYNKVISLNPKHHDALHGVAQIQLTRLDYINGFKNYEVDIKFFNKFIKQSKKNNKYFLKKKNLKKLFNLRKFVTDLLLELGVEIDHVNRDTFKEKNYFFSYRRSLILKERDYGRCLSAISLV